MPRNKPDKTLFNWRNVDQPSSTAQGLPPAAPAVPASPGPTRSASSSSAPREWQPAPPLPPAASDTATDDAAIDDPPPDLHGKTVWVIDAPSLIFQVFHAIPEMTSPRGQPVNAVFGFTRDLFQILDQKKPDYLFCAFDTAEPTFRHEQFSAYKGKRGEMPDDLAPQWDLIDRMLTGLSIPSLGLPGYEADDILATIAHQTEQAGGECFLVSGDKDCRQLLSDRVRIYNNRKNQVLDAAWLMHEWGIRPDQVADFQALVGDAVDNVPGVPLIGPKIAGELLAKYGTLEEVLAHAHEVSGQKRRENLIAFRELALKSRELTRLQRDVPLIIPWARAKVSAMDRSAALPICVELGFHGFANRLRAELASRQPAVASMAQHRAVASLQELRSIVQALRGSQERPEGATTNVEDLGAASQAWRGQSVIALQCVGTHSWPRWGELAGLALAASDSQTWFVPLAPHCGERGLDRSQALPILGELFHDAKLAIVGHDLKRAVVLARQEGLALAGERFDTMVASYLLESGERNHSLQEIAKRYLHGDAPSLAPLAAQALPLTGPALDHVAALACRATALLLPLRPLLEESLRQAGLWKLFRELEMPLVDVLAELEFNGIRVDAARLAQLRTQYEARLAQLQAEIFALAGHEFNIASPKQLAQVLFHELKLPVMRKTQTGASTDADVLEKLAKHHSLPAKIVEFRQFAKLKGTYVDALPAMIHPRTGRVHTSFNQTVAATGRLSSSDPNLQNIPIRHESGKEIRSAFLPQAGWKLLAADYSQIELRVLAHFSGDEALQAAFARDEDIHARVASEVHNVPLESVTPEMRRQAKVVNFGVVYGQTPFGLAQELGIEPDAAAAFIEAYFRRYAGVDAFLTSVLETCRRQGYVTTILGRRRAIHGVRGADEGGATRQRNLPERTAVNTVIQGSAADIIKLAMLHIHKALAQSGLAARMLLQIHDELVFEVHADSVTAVAELVQREMTQAASLSVPLKVDLCAGDNWAAMEDLTESIPRRESRP